jgi:hypothetical protein
LNQLLIDAVEAVNQTIVLGVQSLDLRETFVEDFDTAGFCPEQVDLDQLGEETGLDWDEAVSTAQAYLGDLNLTNGQLVEVREALADVQDDTQVLVDTTDNIDIGDWQSLIIIIP